MCERAWVSGWWIVCVRDVDVNGGLNYVSFGISRILFCAISTARHLSKINQKFDFFLIDYVQCNVEKS